MPFELHPQLKQDTLTVTDLKLCRVLLMNNNNFTWLILVPKIADAVELTELSDENYALAMSEIKHVANAIKSRFNPYKLNIAALGNMVRQLHIHIIARNVGDAAWPNPVWGAEGKKYSQPQAEELIKELKTILG